VETQAPANFELPRGQWRLRLSQDPAYQGAVGWHELGNGFRMSITAIGDSTVPAFARNDDPTHDQYGVFYVGNRPILILPLMGGVGPSAFILAGLLIIGLALFVGTVYAKRAKLGPWKEDEGFIARMQALGHSCANCKHGFGAVGDRAACTRYGVVPLDRVCTKFEQKGAEEKSAQLEPG